MPIREDEIKPRERTLLDPGFYFGNIWSVERREEVSARTGEPYARYLFITRLIQDGERNALPRPTRVVASLFDNIAASVKASFGGGLMLGKACQVEIGHREFMRATGEVRLDDEGKPVIDPQTGNVVEIREPAIAHDVQRIAPDRRGKALTREQMEEIEEKERPQAASQSSQREDFADAGGEEEPAF